MFVHLLDDKCFDFKVDYECSGLPSDLAQFSVVKDDVRVIGTAGSSKVAGRRLFVYNNLIVLDSTKNDVAEAESPTYACKHQ